MTKTALKFRSEQSCPDSDLQHRAWVKFGTGVKKELDTTKNRDKTVDSCLKHELNDGEYQEYSITLIQKDWTKVPKWDHEWGRKEERNTRET